MIILFDGVCNLCNQSVKFIIQRDTDEVFKFASLQSKIGKELLEKHGISNELDSLVLIDGKRSYTKSTAALKISGKLKGPVKMSSAFLLIPAPIRDLFYDYVAENRYKWFGKDESCLLPNAKLNGRFLD